MFGEYGNLFGLIVFFVVFAFSWRVAPVKCLVILVTMALGAFVASKGLGNTTPGFAFWALSFFMSALYGILARLIMFGFSRLFLSGRVV